MAILAGQHRINVVIIVVILAILHMVILAAIPIAILVPILVVPYTISPMLALLEFGLERVLWVPLIAADPASINSTAMSSQLVTPKECLLRSVAFGKKK